MERTVWSELARTSKLPWYARLRPPETFANVRVAVFGDFTYPLGLGYALAREVGLDVAACGTYLTHLERDFLFHTQTFTEGGFVEDDPERVANKIVAARPDLVVGTELERAVARDLDVPFLPLCYPAGGRPFVESPLMGYRGSSILADRLDNGAGYARYLAQRPVLEELLARVFDVLGTSFLARHHAGTCDAACPDCLASYDNRFLHPQLDWRLGVDLAEVAAGRRLDERRWLDSAETIATATAEGFDLECLALGQLFGLRHPDTDNVVILGHPMWLVGSAPPTGAQRDAQRAARARLAFHADLHTALRYPQQLVPLLEATTLAPDGPAVLAGIDGSAAGDGATTSHARG